VIGQVTETATNTIMDSKKQVETVKEHIDSKHADQLMETKGISMRLGFFKI
jgi:hypothetical protein